MVNKISLILILSFISIINISAQTQPSLDEILNQAEIQTTNYQETFRNLLALETKTFIDFDKNGLEKKRNTVEADFLVYQSSKNNKISFELRNVKKVDGKPIPNSDKNSDIFFAELNKTTTLKSELEKIQKVSSKYDKTLEISGLTLYEGIILSKNLRSYFDFKFENTEQLNGQEFFLVSYTQTKQSPFISINRKETDPNNPSLDFEIDVPRNLRKNNILLQGKFWIDSKSFQIQREERELYIQAEEPLILLSTSLEYQPSDYGILVPKQIKLTYNRINKKDGKYFTVSELMIFFDYTKFRKTETDVKILDDSEN